MPKLIVKCGYTKNVQHFVNNLEYAGNKINSQQVVLLNGTVKNFDGCKKINFNDIGIENIAAVFLSFKDGVTKSVSAEAYEKKIEKSQNVTVERIIEEVDDNDTEKKQPRELQELDFFKYMSYVGERPGAVRENGFGLFSLKGDILPSAAEDLAKTDDFKRGWMHIISMSAADAQRTGFDNRAAWRDLAISKAPEIAKAYNISLENLRFYGGFHANTDNPHVHINFYSTDSNEGYVTDLKKASKKVKSLFTNAIFKDDVLEIKEAIGIAKNEMSQALAKVLAMKEVKPEYVTKLKEISYSLPTHGKMQYQFAPAQTKELIKNLLRTLLKDESLEPIFQGYLKGYELYAQLYADNVQVIDRQKTAAAEDLVEAAGKNSWRRLHNEIMQAAVAIRNINNEVPVINNTNRAPVGNAPNVEIKSPKEQGGNPLAELGTYISTFAQYLPDYYIKQLASNECKEATAKLYKIVSNTIKDKIISDPNFAQEMQQGYLDLSHGEEISIDSISTQAFTNNSEADLQKSSWLAAMKENIAKIVPADMQMHVVETLDKYINTANRTLPFNNTIYHSIANFPETITNCVLSDNPLFDEFKKTVNHAIVCSIRNGQQPKGDKTISTMLRSLNMSEDNTSTEIKSELTEAIKGLPEVANAFYALESDFMNAYSSITTIEFPQAEFESAVINDGYQSVGSSVEYYAGKYDALDKFFREERIKDAVLHMFKGIAQGLVSEIGNRQTDLSQPECYLTGQGEFTRKHGSLAPRNTHKRNDLNW